MFECLELNSYIGTVCKFVIINVEFIPLSIYTKIQLVMCNGNAYPISKGYFHCADMDLLLYMTEQLSDNNVVN